MKLSYRPREWVRLTADQQMLVETLHYPKLWPMMHLYGIYLPHTMGTY